MSSNAIMKNSKDIAVSCDSISKKFEVYKKPQDRLKQALRRGKKAYHQDFWAIRDISFEIKRGETVGIVGQNGSGKSTLLQLICGTLTPSSGAIYTNGRISALLELGSGFNPEFTGRENIYLNASILGLTNKEIEEELDKILAFADIGDFVDQPVKNYSSGMVVRLAFAVAINIKPDILVVDEALSVGDERFQRKCFAKIEDIKESGASVLFVSHSPGTVVQLCERALLINAGELLLDGKPKPVIGYYQKLLYAPNESRSRVLEEIRESKEQSFVSFTSQDQISSENATASLPTTQEETAQISASNYDPNLRSQSSVSYKTIGAKITNPIVHSADNHIVNILQRGNSYFFSYVVNIFEQCEFLQFGMLIKTTTGIELGGYASSPSSKFTIKKAMPGEKYIVRFSFCCRLNPGTYFLNAGVIGSVDGNSTYLHRILDASMFRVSEEPEMLPTGIIDFSCNAIVQAG